MGETFWAYVKSELHRDTPERASCEASAMCVFLCAMTRVTALTLSGDITVHQYQADKSGGCHSRRAKAL